MTLTQQASAGPFELVTLDLYKDIHKAIRAELFAVTGSAGELDPGDRGGRADLARHVGSVVDMLVAHAEHEDTHGQAALETHLPDLAARVACEHAALEARLVDLRALAEGNVDAVSQLRGRTHTLYLDLASFTSDYLAHQDMEEREIMPALDRAIGFDAVLAIHQAIISSLSPAEMAQSLPLMMQAMNIDDRTEMLGAMLAGAPAEVFAGVWSLVGSVLSTCDRAALADRLGVASSSRLHPIGDEKRGGRLVGALPVSQGRTASPPEHTVDGQAFCCPSRTLVLLSSAAAPTPARRRVRP